MTPDATLRSMRTLISDPPPIELQALLERRRQSGADRFDEVWEGVLHIMPATRGSHDDVLQQLMEHLGPVARRVGLLPTVGGFNIGEPGDFRIPDGGLRRGRVVATWYPTAALAVEVVSPGDETWDKLPFYASHGVDELLIVDPEKRSVDWLALKQDEYESVERSGLIDLSVADLRKRIDWPPNEECPAPEQH